MGARKRTPPRDPAPVPAPASSEVEVEGVEVIRVSIYDGLPHVYLAPVVGMGSPERWGSLLCDTLLHIANAYSMAGEHDFERTAHRIFHGLHARWQQDVTINGMLLDNRWAGERVSGWAVGRTA